VADVLEIEGVNAVGRGERELLHVESLLREYVFASQRHFPGLGGLSPGPTGHQADSDNGGQPHAKPEKSLKFLWNPVKL